jgi:glycosyltransferase involved in cell wall biosynthesis
MYRAVRSQAIDMRREFRFDVILGAFAYPDVVVASRLARDAGCPLVALVMGSDMNDLAQRPRLRDDIRQALHHASRVVAVSKALQHRVLELGVPRGRIVVQHNGVSGDRFRIRDRFEARRAVGISHHGHLVCFVGNLVYEKGADVLIEALGHLRSLGATDLRVVLIGDGCQKQELLSKATALDFGDRISFVGRLGPDDVALWMAAADALILPSRREGCPNVVLEALASGRPVVAAAVGGVPELLNDRNGVMVPADDPVALARGIAGALERQWDAAEVRATVPALTWKKVGRTLHDVLAQAVFDHRQSLADRTRRTAPIEQ